MQSHHYPSKPTPATHLKWRTKHRMQSHHYPDKPTPATHLKWRTKHRMQSHGKLCSVKVTLTIDHTFQQIVTTFTYMSHISFVDLYCVITQKNLQLDGGENGTNRQVDGGLENTMPSLPDYQQNASKSHIKQQIN